MCGLVYISEMVNKTGDTKFRKLEQGREIKETKILEQVIEFKELNKTL